MLQKQRKDHIRIECWVTSNTVEGLLIRIVKCSLDLATRKWVYSKGLIEKTKRVFWSRVQGPKDGNYVECCERGQCRSFQTQRSVSHFPTSSCCGVPCLTPGHHCLCSLCEMKIPVTSCCLPLAGLKNFFFLFLYYFWLCWTFFVMCGVLIAEASLLQSTGSRCSGFSSYWYICSVVVAHGFSCPMTCGIFPDQGQNSCPLNWQADS